MRTNHIKLRLMHLIYICAVIAVSISACNTSFSAEKGPVLEYNFTEGSGVVLADKSGNGNTGAIYGAKWEKDAQGSYLTFNGVDDYVEVKDSPSLKLGDEFTVEVKVKPGENAKKPGSGTYRLIIGKSGDIWNPNDSFALYVNEGGKLFTGYTRYGSNKSFNANEVNTVTCRTGHVGWLTITLVKTKDKIRVFRDNLLLDESPADKTTINSTSSIRIGGMLSRFFEGSIRSVKIYNYSRNIKGYTYNPQKKLKKAYMLMVTSMDQSISSTPLLDVSKANIDTMNGSPFDGVAFNLVDIYSAQRLPDADMVMQKAGELKSISRKDIWVRVNANRMYQRGSRNAYYKNGWKMADVAELPVKGIPVSDVRRKSTPYFSDIKVMDLYDRKGALSDFYEIWRLALKFTKAMSSGVALDLEDYGSRGVYRVADIAQANSKTVDEVIEDLAGVGKHMVDIAAREHPDVKVIVLFTFMNNPDFDGQGHYASIAYIVQGMLMRAKEKNVPIKLIEGGELGINYVNRTLDGLKGKIDRRGFYSQPWVTRFPKNFELGGTITLWDDISKLSAWTKKDAGDPNPFQSLNDFEPFLRTLCINYDYIWVYQPSCIDYKPYDDPAAAPDFHNKLKKLFDKVAK